MPALRTVLPEVLSAVIILFLQDDLVQNGKGVMSVSVSQLKAH